MAEDRKQNEGSISLGKAALRWIDDRTAVPGIVIGAGAGLAISAASGWEGAGIVAPLALLGAAVPLVVTGTRRAVVTGGGRPPVQPIQVKPTNNPPIQPPKLPRSPEPKPFSKTTHRINKVTLETTYLPGGMFQMGSADNDSTAYGDEKPQHRVQLSPFWITTVPVTQQLWAEVMKERRGRPDGEDNCPINDVTWFDAVRFCNTLSDHLGLKRCYDIDKEQVTLNPNHDGFRLPTEAQWEYACRAGTETPWFFGADDKRLSNFAWWSENSSGRVQPVGTKLPNPWRLHDMLGNVWEWCWDWYGGYMAETTPPAKDPLGPTDGSMRVLRGGAFDVLDPRFFRSAFRVRGEPSGQYWYCGFRCVRSSVREL